MRWARANSWAAVFFSCKRWDVSFLSFFSASTRRRFAVSAARAAPRNARRKMGGGGEPGTLFGEKPGDPPQGWEPIIYSCYAACAVLLGVGLANKPTTSINSWAKEEAAVRLKRKADGEDVEYGKHYADASRGLGWESYAGGRVRAYSPTVGGAFDNLQKSLTKEIGQAPVREEEE